MVKLTKEQQIALKRVFDRCELIKLADGFHNREAMASQYLPESLATKIVKDAPKVTYLTFRRDVRQGWDCVMVQWCGMWLGIETNGYIHS
jgi:hypothetical protein